MNIHSFKLCFVGPLLSIQTVFFLLFLFVLHPKLAYIFMSNISLYSMFAYGCLSTIDLLCLSRGIPIVILFFKIIFLKQTGRIYMIYAM